MKPLNFSIRKVLITAIVLIASAGIVDGIRNYRNSKAAAADQVTVLDLEASASTNSRSL